MTDRTEQPRHTLLLAVGRGDEDALRQFYDATSGQLCRLLSPLVDPADRDDVLVDVYVEVGRGAAARGTGGLEVVEWLAHLALVRYASARRRGRSALLVPDADRPGKSAGRGA